MSLLNYYKDYGKSSCSNIIHNTREKLFCLSRCEIIRSLYVFLLLLTVPTHFALYLSSFVFAIYRKHAPNIDDMSTVADFNDNLLYHMKREHGLDNFICDDDDECGNLRSSHVQELEETLQADEYIGSFLTTKSTTAQPPHVDYTWEVLEQYGEENPTQSLMLGFFPLTEEGMCVVYI